MPQTEVIEDEKGNVIGARMNMKECLKNHVKRLIPAVKHDDIYHRPLKIRLRLVFIKQIFIRVS